MNKIFKYRLTLMPTQTIELPQGADIKHINTVDDDIYIWALIDTLAPIKDVVIRMFATGEEIPNIKLWYIGTVLQLGGKYVWHVFRE